MRTIRRMIALLLCLLLLAPTALAELITVYAGDYPVYEGGWYDSMEEVAVYLTLYDALPDNYLTKKQAQALGWDSRRGNLWAVAEGCSIGAWTRSKGFSLCSLRAMGCAARASSRPPSRRSPALPSVSARG